MIPIGGYFELELNNGEEYHKKAIRLNTGRNALELIIGLKQYKKVYIPCYTCDVILEPFKKLKIDYEFYSIDEKFEPLINFNKINDNEGFLYINYFGLKDLYISKLVANCKNLIIDNSQAFFTLPKPQVPTFYSCRKFFGLPDGAYLYLDGASHSHFPIDSSTGRFNHLLKRIDFGAEAGYFDFKANENSLIGQQIMQMSRLTKALLCNINYEFVRKKRIENFLILHDHFSKMNELEICLDQESVPMVYPLLTSIRNLKEKLIKNKIFVASYWPNVIKWSNIDSLEYKFASRLISLPIDQRVDKYKLDIVINNIERDGK